MILRKIKHRLVNCIVPGLLLQYMLKKRLKNFPLLHECATTMSKIDAIHTFTLVEVSAYELQTEKKIVLCYMNAPYYVSLQV